MQKDSVQKYWEQYLKFPIRKEKAVDLYEGKVAVSSVGVPVSYLKPNQKWTNFGIAHTTAIISFAPDKASGKAS
jgi:hypothetical protein